MEKLSVTMFGEFTVSARGQSISDNTNRSRKVWSLLAYLIFNRKRVVKQNELIELLWGKSASMANPAGALKTLCFRARSELDKLWNGAGHDLIVSRGDGYTLNPDVEVDLDCDTFDRLCELHAAGGGDTESLLSLLSLYRGTFLSKSSSEFWVMPIATHYHNAFMSALMSGVPTLLESGHCAESAEFCRLGVELDPFNEELHQLYMQTCIKQGDKKKALKIYRELSNRLLSELGVFPSRESRDLYHQVMQTTNDHTLTASMLMEQLREDGGFAGALVCEYDFFRVLYYSMARSVMRNGIAVHLILFSLSGQKDQPLTGKKLEREMSNLLDAARLSLRRGDSATRCSVSQVVAMLPGANFENGEMVAERIAKNYRQKFSYPDTELRYQVIPLEPDTMDTYVFNKFGKK